MSEDEEKAAFQAGLKWMLACIELGWPHSQTISNPLPEKVERWVLNDASWHARVLLSKPAEWVTHFSDGAVAAWRMTR